MSESPYKIAGEIARSRIDGIKMFRSDARQDPVITCNGESILVKGGNRSGKTTIVAMLVAAIIRDMKLTLSNGEVVHARREHQRGRPLIVWIIGLKWTHIGNTIHRVLFRPGLYKIIRDEGPGREWRAFNPEKDAHREAEAKPSPPLIPMSAIKGGEAGIAWEDKKEKQFSRCELVDGTTINCFASTGDVERGVPVDVIWIDEEVNNPNDVAEWKMRLLDTNGFMIWSTTAYANHAIIRLSEQAKEQEIEHKAGERKDRFVYQFTLDTRHNKHISQDRLAREMEGLSEEERTMRVAGEFNIGKMRIYPMYKRSIHAAIRSGIDPVSDALRANGGYPPLDWTCELILDPGTAKPAVLFGAIPPPSLTGSTAPVFIVYDEIYIFQQPADQIARRIKSKTPPGRVYQRFIIDGQAGRQTPMGFNSTIQDNYSQAFARAGVRSIATNHRFIFGDPSFETGSMRVERAFLTQVGGLPQLRVNEKACPQTVFQLEHNMRATIKTQSGTEIATDKPAKNQADDLRRNLEYWIGSNPRYVPPMVNFSGVQGRIEARQRLIEEHSKRKPSKHKTITI